MVTISCQNVQLLEKGWLHQHIFGFVKIDETNANQTKALLGPQVHSLPERQCDFGQFVARRGRRTGGMAAGEYMKFACLQFEYHGTRNARFLARRGPGFFRQSAYRWLRFYQRHIALERVLNGDGLCRSVWDDFAVVQASGEFIQTQTVASEAAFECRYIQASQVSHRPYAKLLQLLSRHFAYTR